MYLKLAKLSPLDPSLAQLNLSLLVSAFVNNCEEWLEQVEGQDDDFKKIVKNNKLLFDISMFNWTFCSVDPKFPLKNYGFTNF